MSEDKFPKVEGTHVELTEEQKKQLENLEREPVITIPHDNSNDEGFVMQIPIIDLDKCQKVEDGFDFGYVIWKAKCYPLKEVTKMLEDMKNDHENR